MSHGTCGCFMAHMMSRGTYEWMAHMHESWRIYMSHGTCACFMAHMNESWHMWMSHGTCEWVMAHMYESWHICMSHGTYACIIVHTWIDSLLIAFKDLCVYVCVCVCVYGSSSNNSRADSWACLHKIIMTFWKCCIPAINQIQKLGIPSISRYKIKWGFWLILNLNRGIRVSWFRGSRGCSIFSENCHMELTNVYAKWVKLCVCLCKMCRTLFMQNG